MADSRAYVLRVLVLSLSSICLFSGCGLTKALGPKCGDFLTMSEQDQTNAVLSWARLHDSTVDQSNPNSGLSGFAVFRDRGSLITYCQDQSHSNEHLNSLAPVG